MTLHSDDLRIEYRSVADLKPYARNARTHSKKQVKQIARSIERFGFVNPILVDEEGAIIAGHGRCAAAKLLGMEAVPTVRLSHLSADERRAYVLADNQLAAKAGWDRDLLAKEVQTLIDVEFDLDLAGFDTGEIDLILEEADEKSGKGEPEASVPPVQLPIVSRLGDVWQLGGHRIICGDARDEEVYRALLGSEQAGLVFTDPPYNVPIDGHVCGLGSVKRAEFPMASGEMSKGQFTAFLSGFLSAATLSCRDGAILFICMDWRHLRELLDAGDEAGLELKNLCVWNKSNGGMGTFYRSKHELILVWKHGTAPHVNTFGLGQGAMRGNG